MLQNMPEFKPSEVVVAEEVLDDYLRDPVRSGYNVFVAEIGSSVVGYICYGPTPLTESTWDIYWLAVTPDQQSQGIGKSLLVIAEENIKESKGTIVVVETSSKTEYEASRHFYRAQGYEMLCSIADFYAPGDNKLIFLKRLN